MYINKTLQAADETLAALKQDIADFEGFPLKLYHELQRAIKNKDLKTY